MPLITWSDRLKVGIERIDKQHHQLVDLLNALHAEMLAGRGMQSVGEVLSNLIQYTRTHFATEERLFTQHAYPQAEAHKQQHDKLAEKAVALHRQVVNGEVTLSLETMHFLKDWLTNHILKTDMAYKPFFASKGLK